jgi:hypothetical protein
MIRPEKEHDQDGQRADNDGKSFGSVFGHGGRGMLE